MTRHSEPPEGWDAALPPRLPLHRRPPTEAGTGLVAGLASHLMELAAEYELAPGVLLLESVGPVLVRPDAFGPNDGDGHYFSRYLSKTPSSVNGRDDLARLIAYALGELTGQPGLERCTALPLARVLPAKGLLRRVQAHCPDCLADWQARRRPLYHPLLWAFSEVTHCGIHGTPLRTRCPSEECGAEQRVLTYFGRPGICVRFGCGRLLGSLGQPSRRPVTTDPTSAWGVWVWGQVSRLLEAIQAGAEPTGEGIAEAIGRVVGGVAGGNGAAFGRSVGAAKSVVCDWRAARSLPTLGHALRICAVADVELVAFLGGRLERAVAGFPGTVPPLREPHRRVAWDSLALALSARAGGKGAGAVESILGDFRADRRTAVRRLRVPYAGAVAGASEDRRAATGARQAEVAARIRHAVADCVAEGRSPSKDRVQRRTGIQIRSGRALRVYRDAVTQVAPQGGLRRQRRSRTGGADAPSRD